MKRALKISASVPVHSLERYIAEELQNSEWVVSAVMHDLSGFYYEPRVHLERTLMITPDAFKQHRHE